MAIKRPKALILAETLAQLGTTAGVATAGIPGLLVKTAIDGLFRMLISSSSARPDLEALVVRMRNEKTARTTDTIRDAVIAAAGMSDGCRTAIEELAEAVSDRKGELDAERFRVALDKLMDEFGECTRWMHKSKEEVSAIWTEIADIKKVLNDEALRMRPAELAAVQDWISRQFNQVGSRNKRGLALVHFAAKDGRRDVLAWLKIQGEDINAKDNDGQTPIFYAATVGHDEIIVWLISQGADVNARDKDDKTPMHYAARRDQLGSMKILKAHGADINAKDNNGQTPIFGAVIANRVNAMCWLKAEGADIDVNARDKNSKTLTDHAAQYDCTEAMQWLRKQNGI